MKRPMPRSAEELIQYITKKAKLGSSIKWAVVPVEGGYLAAHEDMFSYLGLLESPDLLGVYTKAGIAYLKQDLALC